jgi:hypothetical protein
MPEFSPTTVITKHDLERTIAHFTRIYKHVPNTPEYAARLWDEFSEFLSMGILMNIEFKIEYTDADQWVISWHHKEGSGGIVY